MFTITRLCYMDVLFPWGKENNQYTENFLIKRFTTCISRFRHSCKLTLTERIVNSSLTVATAYKGSNSTIQYGK